MNPAPIRRFWFLLLLIFLFTLLSVTVFSEERPRTSARSAALYEARAGLALIEHNANERLPMASTTKIMTALVALEEASPDTVVTVPAEAVGIEGSSLYLREGERFTVEELLYGLMLRSANDAACALAYAVAGSVEAFCEKMNGRAAALGLENTHFENPHGLDDEEHYTTARELTRLACEAMKNDTFRTIVSTKTRRIGEGESVRVLTNHNKMLRLYDGAIGVKTGFTKRSGRCLVSAAERDGVLLIATTIDAPNDWSDHTAMLDYGFRTVVCRTEAEAGAHTYEVPVLGGKKASVTVTNREGFSHVAYRTDAPLTCEVKLTRFAAAPVTKGDILGTVTFYKDGECLSTLPLRATQDVAAAAQRRRFFGFLQNRTA